MREMNTRHGEVMKPKGKGMQRNRRDKVMEVKMDIR